MVIDEKLLKEIEQYCSSNDIADIEKEVNKILRIGFNVIRFGVSPFSKPTSIEVKQEEPIKAPKKRVKKEVVEIPTVEEKTEEEKPKKKVRIIKSK